MMEKWLSAHPAHGSNRLKKAQGLLPDLVSSLFKLRFIRIARVRIDDRCCEDGRNREQCSIVDNRNPIIVFSHLLALVNDSPRSEEHTSELQSLMRISYAVFCLKTKN